MENKIKRNFILGDEWIYFKIYTGIKTADLILINHLNELLKKMIVDQSIDKWFFIRYSDPDFHLRLRLNIKEPSKLVNVINEINLELKKLLALNLIWKIQLDTYNRELERYGFSIIDRSESLFFYDSKLIIESLVILEESQSQKLKWLFGLLVIDSIMEDFGLTLYEKKSLIENLKNNFGVEMGIDKNLRKQLSLKYQKNKLEIFNFLDKNTFVDEDTRLLKSLIKNKSKFAINDIRIIKDYEKDSNNINNIIASHIHMGMNRLFRTKNRQTEFVSYQMLYYYYESIIARSKYDKQLINVKSIENQ